MKKTYQMFLALVAMLLLGSVNVSAEEIEISLDQVPFWKHAKFNESWYPNIQKTTQITPGEDGCFWVIGQACGQPYGDSDVSSFADLSGFDKLVITYSEGSPRVLLNRDYDDGQWDATEGNSHLIDNTKGGWSSKYFKTEDNTLTVDLKQLVKDKGFAYLHAIKGADWKDVNIESMVVTRQGKEKQVGWINILTNGDLEGDDLSSFKYALHANSSDGNVTYDAQIEDGVGKDGSRGLSILSDNNAAETWSTQLFVVLPEVLPAGTQWRFSMDACSNPNAEIGIGCHAEPRNWKAGGSALSSDFSSNLNLTPDWSTVSASGTISEDLAGMDFQSLCFDLNLDKTTATQYYFDNIKFEIYKYGTIAEFKRECVKVDFGFDTNIAELCKAAGKRRVLFPVENAKVLANGEEVEILSVEGFADGRFYIFLGESLDDDAEVQVSFKNTADDLQLVYAGGPNAGEVIPNVDETADYNDELDDVDDAYSYYMLSPSVVSAYPEQGSFNIKKDLKEFNVKFDKLADASQIVATLDGNALTVNPNEGFAEEFVLTYAGDDLADGLHTINITKIYPEVLLAEEVYADTTYQFSVGAPDGSDVLEELIPLSYFNDCGDGGVPEGFKLYADNKEERTPGNGYGGGNRMMAFNAGGDFTKGLYMRTWYLTYGANDDDHLLTMEAGKKYTISFNSCQWAGSGHYMKFQITKDDEEVFYQVVENSPNINEKKDAVTGSTFTSIDFTPTTTGNYVMNWIVAKDADGTPTDNDWSNGVILANVKVAHIPATYGVVEMMAVNEALQNAEKTLADNNGERYDGSAQAALTDAITTVTTEKENYNSPSECNNAVELLNTCSAALIDHVNLCNNYDTQIKTGSATVDQNKDTKFNKTELYAQLVIVVDKYHGKSWMQNMAEEGAEAKWERQYEYDVLKDDAELTAAVAELTEIATTTANLFTVHNSSNSETDGNLKLETRGTAALVERLYLGAQALKVFDPEDEAIQTALDALDDDDEIAETLMAKIKIAVYGKLKDNENIFETIDNSDPENPETKAVAHNMSVFVKNPNFYAREFSKAIPGWTENEWAWSNWNSNLTHSKKTAYAEDCAIHPGWHAVGTVEQTITNLPKGVYTIKYKAWDNDTPNGTTYAYVKTSATPAVEDGAELDRDVNYAGYADMVDKNIPAEGIQNIVVNDGILTIGFTWGNTSQAMFEYVNLFLTGKAEGVDYNKEYGETVGIETMKAADKASNGVIYNLAGQKVNNSFKGIVIKNGKKFVVK